MNCKIEESYYKSSNGKNDIYTKFIIPSNVKGVIVFCHGMCEYFDKYLEFHNFVADNGYVICGSDFIGHGLSIQNNSDRGFFAEKNGYEYLVNDLAEMIKKVKLKFPNKPLYLLGHSMGSLISRVYVSNYKEKIDALLLCGTVGPQPLIDSAISFADLIIKRKGERYRSRRLNQILMDFANISFMPVSQKYDWTTSDKKMSLETANDEKQNFIFTASAFKDLFELVKIANLDKNIKKVSKDLPIYFFSGSEDPVGEKGAGVKRAVKLYKDAKVKDVTLKLYENYRHEMLREKNRKDVFKDVLDYLDLVRFGEE